MNGIDFEEVKVNIAKGEHRRPEFKGDSAFDHGHLRIDCYNFGMHIFRDSTCLMELPIINGACKSVIYDS